MGTFRGYICNSIGEYNAKSELIHSLGEGKAGYNSPMYCGAMGRPDVLSVDGKPIIIEPRLADTSNDSDDSRNDWVRDARANIVSFTDLDKSIIKVEDI